MLQNKKKIPDSKEIVHHNEKKNIFLYYRIFFMYFIKNRSINKLIIKII